MEGDLEKEATFRSSFRSPFHLAAGRILSKRSRGLLSTVEGRSLHIALILSDSCGSAAAIMGAQAPISSEPEAEI